MNPRTWSLIVGFLFLILAGVSSYQQDTFHFAINIILANMWIISASFKE